MKTYPKAIFLPKIKDWSYSLKMSKLFFFISLYIFINHVKTHSGFNTMFKKFINISKKLFKNVKN